MHSTPKRTRSVPRFVWGIPQFGWPRKVTQVLKVALNTIKRRDPEVRPFFAVSDFNEPSRTIHLPSAGTLLCAEPYQIGTIPFLGDGYPLSEWHFAPIPKPLVQSRIRNGLGRKPIGKCLSRSTVCFEVIGQNFTGWNDPVITPRRRQNGALLLVLQRNGDKSYAFQFFRQDCVHHPLGA